MIIKPMPTTGVSLVPIDQLRPSPENDEIYGAIDPRDTDLINLALDIASNGIREPIQVSADGFIVSGHRRHAAAKLARQKNLPTVYLSLRRDEYSELEWKKLLRQYNHQRVKPAAVRIKEAMLDIDPDIAHKQLVAEREIRDRTAPPRIDIVGQKNRSAISSRKFAMRDAMLKVVEELRPYWPLSDRQIHYGLLNAPPPRNTSKGSQGTVYANDRQSYSDLCNLLTRARLLGLIPWEALADETRTVTGTRFPKDAAAFADGEVFHFLRGYRRDLLQSQPDHIELIVEKLTVQSIISPVAQSFCVPMTVGRGYCSIHPRYELVQRFRKSGKQRLILLIAADFDPDGEEIAESLARSIRDDFKIDDVVASKILLRQDQVNEWKLPSNGLEAKNTSSKYHKFLERYGDKAVFELEAVPPPQIQAAVREAIESTLDLSLFNAELGAERQEAATLHGMKKCVVDLFRDMSENMEDTQHDPRQ